MWFHKKFAIKDTVEGLPVYDASDVAWTRQGIDEASLKHQATFLRRAYLARRGPLGHLGLQAVLRISDEQFESVADLCDARVVEHRFGLAKISPDIVNNREFAAPEAPPLVPAGYSLVAEVEVLKHIADMPTANYNSLRTDIAHFYDTISPGTIFWSDLGPNQFTYNRLPRKAGELVIHDVDPQLTVEI